MAAMRAPVHIDALRERKADRRTALPDAVLEAIAFMDETAGAVARIHDAELARDIPSASVIHEASRLAFRASAAKAELLTLTGGTDDVA